jgi:hypothetical protein
MSFLFPGLLFPFILVDVSSGSVHECPLLRHYFMGSELRCLHLSTVISCLWRSAYNLRNIIDSLTLIIIYVLQKAVNNSWEKEAFRIMGHIFL